MESVALPAEGDAATTGTANFDSELVGLAPLRHRLLRQRR